MLGTWLSNWFNFIVFIQCLVRRRWVASGFQILEKVSNFPHFPSVNRFLHRHILHLPIMSRPASSVKPNTAAAAPVVAPPTASTAPKRKDPDVVDPAPAAPGPDDSEKKGKFAPPDAAQSNGIVDIASSSERKEYFNIFEKAITMAQFELIYEEYSFLPGN